MKILNAQIKDEKIEIEGVNPEDIKLLAKGQANSSGFVLFGDEFAVYIVNTQPDLERIVDKLVGVCDQLITIGQSTLMLGGTGSSPQQPYKPVEQSASDIKKELEGFKFT